MNKFRKKRKRIEPYRMNEVYNLLEDNKEQFVFDRPLIHFDCSIKLIINDKFPSQLFDDCQYHIHIIHQRLNHFSFSKMQRISLLTKRKKILDIENIRLELMKLLVFVFSEAFEYFDNELVFDLLIKYLPIENQFHPLKYFEEDLHYSNYNMPIHTSFFIH